MQKVLSDLIRSLFKKNRPSSLAKALMNLGRIIKTLYLLNYIDSEKYQAIFWDSSPQYSNDSAKPRSFMIGVFQKNRNFTSR